MLHPALKPVLFFIQKKSKTLKWQHDPTVDPG